MPVQPAAQRLRRYLSIFFCSAIVAMATAAPSHAQLPPSSPAPATPSTTAPKSRATAKPATKPDAFAEMSRKYPGLLEEFAHLLDRLQQETKFPAPRNEDRLTSVLPVGTTAYVAVPNYGDVVNQSLAILRQELQSSAVLQKWWTDNAPVGGTKLEDALEKLARFYDYLGDETALGIAVNAQNPQDSGIVFAAELRKPGVAAFLTEWLSKSASSASPASVRILTPQDIDATLSAPAGHPLLVLVTPNVLGASYSLSALRTFLTAQRVPNRQLGASSFGQRIAQAYDGGVTVLAAADIHKLLQDQLPKNAPDTSKALERSGLADAQYLVWKRAPIAGQIVGEGELNFAGPRRGAAAWLAAPGPLGSLDFVSSKATAAVSIRLSDLSQIYDDVQSISGPGNANTFSAIAGGATALQLRVKDDLLKLFTGELTVEVDSIASTEKPDWKLIAKVNDAGHLQKTLNTLLTVAKIPSAQSATASGVSFTTLTMPGKTPTTIVYAFVDGYLLVAPTPESLDETLRIHGSPQSLSHDPTFLASLPAGQSPDASALFYQNTAGAIAPQLALLSPELVTLLTRFLNTSAPTVARFYAEPNAIREVGGASPFNPGTLLIAAAVAVPTLMHAGLAQAHLSAATPSPSASHGPSGSANASIAASRRPAATSPASSNVPSGAARSRTAAAGAAPRQATAASAAVTPSRASSSAPEPSAASYRSSVSASVESNSATRENNATDADESTAIGTLRSLNTAQSSYSQAYPDRGFAPTIAALGFASDAKDASPEHAALIDQSLSNPTCTAGKWCVKSGYRYQIAALCLSQKCVDYRIVAEPVDPANPSRSFCSTADGIIHANLGPAPAAVPTKAECHSWPRLN